MKKSIILGILMLMYGALFAQGQPKTPTIIPLPNQLEVKTGEFVLDNKTQISYDSDSQKIAELFRDYLDNQYGLDLKTTNKKVRGNAIRFVSAKQNHDEGYTMEVEPNSIEIRGINAGLFYGYQTLVQLLPIETDVNEIKISTLSIKDAPRYSYRGLHLDVGRHMFPLDFIKKYIDILSSYKLNIFHWHLTEDQGWRLEIKKYPKLTEIGAYRNQTLLGLLRPDGDYDYNPYGGFYTQEEAKEIVAYAKERFVTVIPEIEMPGHALAALSAYPELGCGANPGPYTAAQTWGVFDEVFCAGKEQTFNFLQDVLDEVLEIFPSKLIHIGGDECPKGEWEKCEFCQKRIKDEGLKDEFELQSYFIQRIEKYLNSKGRSIIGWDEILEGGLAPNATVMSWRGDDGGIDAANLGHNVIMSPYSYGLYFDHLQGKDRNREPLSLGGYSTMEIIYSQNPTPKELDESKQKHIIGVQGNMWTEYIKTSNRVEFQILPRVLALSEIAWTQNEIKNWEDFSENRAANHMAKFDRDGLIYRVPEVYGLKDTIIYASEYSIRDLKPSVEGAKIYYTLDDYDPTELDQEFIGSVKVVVPNGKERVFKAVVITPSGRKSNYVKAVIINTKK